MANDTNASFSFSLQDLEGVRASTTMYGEIDSSLTVADQVTQWQALATALIGVTNAKIVGGDVRINIASTTTSQSTKPGALTAGQIEQTGVYDFLVTASGKKFGIVVPALLTSKISAGKILLSDTQVAALIAAATGTFTGGVLTSSQYLALGALTDAFLSFRKHRRQLRALSYEV